MSANKFPPNDPLLTPDNHAVMLIDHQYLQLLTVRSHSNDTVVNNATFLAKAAKVFNVRSASGVTRIRQRPVG